MVEEDIMSRRQEHRAFVRGGVTIQASIREHGGGRQIVEVVELSQAGFRVQSSSFIYSGRAIFLKLPGYNQLKARVVWSQDAIYGCEFTSKLHLAIFEDILKRYPQLQRAGSVPSVEKNG